MNISMVFTRILVQKNEYGMWIELYGTVFGIMLAASESPQGRERENDESQGTLSQSECARFVYVNDGADEYCKMCTD